jgi:hypothetical protein
MKFWPDSRPYLCRGQKSVSPLLLRQTVNRQGRFTIPAQGIVYPAAIVLVAEGEKGKLGLRPLCLRDRLLPHGYPQLPSRRHGAKRKREGACHADCDRFDPRTGHGTLVGLTSRVRVGPEPVLMVRGRLKTSCVGSRAMGALTRCADPGSC